jgi:dihydrofolate reductase
MNTTPTTEHHRTVTAKICGAAGPYDMGWIVPHAITNEAHQHITTVTANVSTIVLGRINYEGFSGYWPTVADNPDADPWDRDFSRWLTNTDKTVFSTTLTKTAWANTTIETRPPGHRRHRTPEPTGRRHHRPRQLHHHPRLDQP